MSEDPVGLSASDNLFVYAQNDPIGKRDPSGLDDCFEEGYYLYTYSNKVLVKIDRIVTRTYCVTTNGIGAGGAAELLRGGGGSVSPSGKNKDRSSLPFREAKRTASQCFIENNAFLGKEVTDALVVLGVGISAGISTTGGIANLQANSIVRKTFETGYASDFSLKNGVATVTAALPLLKAGSFIARLGILSASVPIYFLAGRSLCEVFPNYGSSR